MSHWALRLWRIAIWVSFLVTFVGLRSVDDTEADAIGRALANARTEIVYVVIRMAVALLIVIGVWSVAGRIRTLVVTSTIPPRPADYGYAYRPTVAAPLRPAQPPQATTDIRTADGQFWFEVSVFVAQHGGEVPLLETWSGSTRRWHLLKPENLPAVRARLLPGSVLSLYERPPTPDRDAVTQEAAQFLAASPAPLAGLSEDSDGVVLRFAQLSTMDDVSAWLARTANAARLGVYPTAGVPLCGVNRTDPPAVR
jgi:hypothetical protein